MRQGKRAVSAGIGLFIAFIGLVSANIIVSNPATKVSLFSFKGAIAAGTFHTVGVPVLLALSMPAALMMPGLTARIYAIVMKVVMPAMISVLTDV